MQNLFPLPLWQSVRDAMEEVRGSGKYRDDPGDWRSRGETKGKAAKALRMEGLCVCHGLLVLSLNFLYGYRASADRPRPGSQATAAQESALEVLWDMVKVFVDDKEEKGGVPRTPTDEWVSKLDALRISYTGEVIEKAEPLSLEQILPGLPSVGHGGLVDILEVLPEDLKEVMQAPEKLLIACPQGVAPRPKVHCSDEEWPKIVQALLDRGIVQVVDAHPEWGGKEMLNGAFGMPKPEKFTESGKQVLRFIMDLRATNFIMAQIEGDTNTLTGAASFQRIIVEEDKELLISGEDLAAAFYLFRLPPQWAEYMVLEKPVDLSLIGKGTGRGRVGISVLPMGWSSSVGLMQAAHRQIALRGPLSGGAGLLAKAEMSRNAVFPSLDDQAGWSIYLDDTTIFEKVEMGREKELEGKPPEEQQQLRDAYAWWGIPTNKQKTLERTRRTERLGALIDGKQGVLRTTTRRSLDLAGLGAWLKSQKYVPRKGLQVYAGKAVHIVQFRRCLFSAMEEIFSAIARGKDWVYMNNALQAEMILLEMLLPAMQFNLKAKVDPIVTCSDACETGGGMWYSTRMSRRGKEEVDRILDGEDEDKPWPETSLDPKERILVIDLFAGIGGLTMALEKAGVKVHHDVSVEKNADCRRLLRRSSPGGDQVTDVRKFDEEALKVLGKVPGLTGMVSGGGSPCQGLSRLSSQREHLEDPRSKLFYEAVRIFKMVDQEAKKRKIWHIKFLENVVADDEDITDMSAALEMRPVLVDSKCMSLVRRPRLYWFNDTLQQTEEVDLYTGNLYDAAVFKGGPEEIESILREEVPLAWRS